MEDMLSNWMEDHDTVLAVKVKMAEMDVHLTILDSTFAWNCMVGTTGQVGHVDVGSGSMTSGKSWDASSVLTPQLAQAPHSPFPPPLNLCTNG